MPEQTLLLVKPDGVKRGLIGEVMSRIEKTGLTLAGLKLVNVTPELATVHYGAAIDADWYRKIGEKVKNFYQKTGFDPGEKINQMSFEEIGQMIHKMNVGYLTSGPVVAMVWQGVGAVGIIRKLVGTTYPIDSPVGTIRGDLAHDSPVIANSEGRPVYNIVHASGTPAEAKTEIELWFKEEELI